jgi:lysophospholipase L1-like esterase
MLRISLGINALLAMGVVALVLRDRPDPLPPPMAIASESAPSASTQRSFSRAPVSLGPRHTLHYEDWVNILGREAEAAARTSPQHLAILAGDSLSLAFPPELLPPNWHWLNQGISGETTVGLLRRISLLDQVEPEVVFVMIGINDLIHGVGDETILANQRLIVRSLRRAHPNTPIVLQSILPHQGTEARWEGREHLLELPNERIRALNQRLKRLAEREGATYLDLYPLFADARGTMHPALTTDGLHLSERGYLVWRSALQLYAQLQLDLATPESWAAMAPKMAPEATPEMAPEMAPETSPAIVPATAPVINPATAPVIGPATAQMIGPAPAPEARP